MTDTNDSTAAIRALFEIWSTATGNRPSVPHANPATLDYVRELGSYLSEALYATGKAASGLVEHTDRHRQVALEQGLTLDWCNATRQNPQEAVRVLALLAQVLHAAIDGVRLSGKHDVEDAHPHAVQLQEILTAAAGVAGVAEAAQQILAESRGGDR